MQINLLVLQKCDTKFHSNNLTHYVCRIATQNNLAATQILVQVKLQACRNCYTKLVSNYLSADVAQTGSTAETLHKITQ